MLGRPPVRASPGGPAVWSSHVARCAARRARSRRRLVGRAVPRRCGARCPGSRLTVHDVGLNPLRAGFLDVLERMGGGWGSSTGERSPASSSATSRSRAASSWRRRSRPPRCRGWSTSSRWSRCSPRWRTATRASAAPRSSGEGVRPGRDDGRGVCGDRRARRDEARRLPLRGVPSRLRGRLIDAAGDHRIAMLGAVAGVTSSEGVRLSGAEAVAISFPGFFDRLSTVAVRAR